MNVVETKQQFEALRPDTPLEAQLRRLPLESFTRMRLLTPQRGCPNACSFCSQEAKVTQVRFTEAGLNNLFSAIKQVGRSSHVTTEAIIGGWRHEERQGVIHPYYDNDVGSYPYLDTYIDHVDDLNAKTAISTVGWSRHNRELQAMHERIASGKGDALSGVRFSWTPYTYGWTEAAARSGRFSREEMIADYANSLKTYRPLVEQHGTGINQVHAELRFQPIVEAERTELIDTFIDGHHVVHTGPYLLISRETTKDIPPVAAIKAITGRDIEINEEPSTYIMVTSDSQVRGEKWMGTAQKVIEDLSVSTADDLVPDLGENAQVKTVKIFRWENTDGPYYTVDSVFDAETGEFSAKQFFEKTDKRKKSGYTNTERYFLNTLLTYLRDKGIRPHEEFTEATWDDVDAVIAALHSKATELSHYDGIAATDIRNEVIPLVSGYRQALQLADYEPSFFFSRNFTLDTGSSANQGRAIGEFKGLAATADTPMSPWEDRFYGDTSIVSQRNSFWKWSPSPSRVTHFHVGEKGVTVNSEEHSGREITVSELHPRTFTSQTPDGSQLSEYTITGVETEIITQADVFRHYLQPGLIAA